MDKRQLIDLIKYPIITDKSTKLFEENQYSFAVSRKANKLTIKEAIEYIFNVNVKKVNTCNMPIKTKTVGRFTGQKARFKKAIVTLNDKDKINLFPES